MNLLRVTINLPLQAIGQIGGPESSALRPGRLRHSSEIRFGQESLSRSSATKARVESDTCCAKRYTVCEVNHIFDIVDTFFYAARIPAGWFCLGGENVRIFGFETRLTWNLGACVFGY